MLRALTMPDGNVVRPGTILGDVLQYNAARHSLASKLAQAGDMPIENSDNSGMTIDLSFVQLFLFFNVRIDFSKSFLSHKSKK